MSSFAEITQGDLPVLIDFHATWCAPCKAVAPILKELAGKMSGRLRIIKIDVDRNPVLAGQLQVQGVPTLMLFKDGKLLWRQSGVVPLPQLEREIIRALG